jgi:hypothetical protein
MNAYDEERMKNLLRQALPPVKGVGPERDLWPDVLRRLDANSVVPATLSGARGWAWFDGALLAGLVALIAIFPSVIPLFLYYL